MRILPSAYGVAGFFSVTDNDVPAGSIEFIERTEIIVRRHTHPQCCKDSEVRRLKDRMIALVAKNAELMVETAGANTSAKEVRRNVARWLTRAFWGGEFVYEDTGGGPVLKWRPHASARPMGEEEVAEWLSKGQF